MASPKPRPAASRLPLGEDSAIERIAQLMRHASGPPPPGELWIGDDAAVVGIPKGPLILATDAAVGGVHADLALVGLDDLGWKALTATVSDIGAMGGRPLHALVTLCVPAGTDIDLLAAGVAEASAAWECPVIGGDLTSADQVMVSVAASGVMEGDLPPVTRSGASAGDVLLVTGPLGGSGAGLRLLREGSAEGPLVDAHCRPQARLVEGRAAWRAGAGAMIDVSDGLSIDLHRLADASGVGFVLDEVPTATGARLDEALGGGEDYELIIATAEPQALATVFAASGLRAPLVIGRCVENRVTRTLAGAPLPRMGWEHAVS